MTKLCVVCRQKKEYTIDGGWLREMYGDNEYYTCPECTEVLLGRKVVEQGVKHEQT